MSWPSLKNETKHLTGLLLQSSVVVATENETGWARRKHAEWSQQWFLNLSKDGHAKLPRELIYNNSHDFQNCLRINAGYFY